MNPVNPPAAAARPGRLEALDIFKFIVLFFMIQGHLFRALLKPDLLRQSWFNLHEVFHGMVAPGFLFSAGFAAFLAFHAKREKYIHLDGVFFRRLQRILFVVAVGYWLHLPFLSLRKTVAVTAAGRATDFLRVDILQCIGAGLLLFTLLAVAVKRETPTVALTGLLTLWFFLLPEPLRQVGLNPVLDPYFHYDYDYLTTLFPLFPWAGYLFLGILTSFLYTRLTRERFFRLLLVAGLAMFPWIFVFRAGIVKAELSLSGNLNKLGGVFLVLWFSDWLARRAAGPVIEIMKRAGKESLFVYVLHLFVIFNSLFARGLVSRFPDRMGIGGALALTVLVQAAVFSCSLLYGWVKEKQPRLWRWLFYGFWGIFLVVFAARPF